MSTVSQALILMECRRKAGQTACIITGCHGIREDSLKPPYIQYIYAFFADECMCIYALDSVLNVWPEKMHIVMFYSMCHKSVESGYQKNLEA